MTKPEASQIAGQIGTDDDLFQLNDALERTIEHVRAQRVATCTVRNTDPSSASHHLSAHLTEMPSSGVWKVKIDGRDRVMLLVEQPGLILDTKGRPVRGKLKTAVLKENLPTHSKTGFITLHETVTQLLKLLLAADETDAALRLLTMHEQLTYVGRRERHYGAGKPEKDDKGNWQPTFEEWRTVTDKDVLMDIPASAIVISDASATQQRHRELPDRDSLIATLQRDAPREGMPFCADLVHALFDKAERRDEHADHQTQCKRSTALLSGLSLVTVNADSKLQVNASLLMQGPSGIKQAVRMTRNLHEPVPEVVLNGIDTDEAVDPTQTLSGKRSHLTENSRLKNDLIATKAERDEADADRDATLHRAVGVVQQRDHLISEQQNSRDAVLDAVSERFAAVINDLRHELPEDARRDEVLEAIWGINCTGERTDADTHNNTHKNKRKEQQK